MLLISDIHGLWYEYKTILRKTGAQKSLQLGDFGLGFPHGIEEVDLEEIEGTHLFLRGNHDNPAVCRKSSHYVGDYGLLEGDFIDGAFTELMYISGAWSIDKDYRTPGLSWWEEEEMSYDELSKAVNFFIAKKPNIVCSHDCPTSVLSHLYHSMIIPTRTGQAMDVMLDYYKPSYWFFGHHHQSWKKNIDGCTFVCLNELETLDISKRIINVGGNDV